ncbi:MAG TPA: hypothetical protein VJ488_03690 [Dehalococcoidia bacterium]|nr:hypothetical protein [Dehalococcoidia bacterium]
MKAKYTSKLSVNGVDIAVNDFVESYLANIVVGTVLSLKGVDYLRNIELKLEGTDVSIRVNGEEISLTPFPNDLIAGTIKGLVSSFKGVKGINSLHVHVEVK